MNKYINFGTLELDNTNLLNPIQILYDACVNHPDFEFIEIRSHKEKSNIIIVDCLNDQIPSRNNVGIKNRERLALLFNSQKEFPYEVRALRKNFPLTLHQYDVPFGEPASLCIYFEPWSTIERNWTPQLFLKRILWWLEETSKMTLHRKDIVVEQFYFRNSIAIVLPVEFKKKLNDRNQMFTIQKFQIPNDRNLVLSGTFQNIDEKKNNLNKYECIVLSPDPMFQASINNFPKTLGELDDQFVVRGSKIFFKLKDEIKQRVPPEGILAPPENSRTLLILNINVKSKDDSIPERKDQIGFAFLNTTFVELGVACGTLFKGEDKKYYNVVTIGNDIISSDKWQTLKIEPVEINHSINRQFAQKSSGIKEESSNFNGILAGVGSLGSALADIWSKEAWGYWTYIDDDYIKPHNIVRHIARNYNIGMNKVNVVNFFTDNNFNPGYTENEIIIGKANNFNDPKVISTIKATSLFIDATTTLDVPRDIALNDLAPRSASVFITPSGESSVILLEDKERSIRLDSLESQYYRALINNSYGENHLIGHSGEMWVGAGCRDASGIMSQELVLLHAATLAQQTRKAVESSKATIRIWELKEDTGSINCYIIPVQTEKSCICENWEIKWDEGFYLKISSLRKSSLPKETGGIIVGYIDQKQKSIYIVDILEAPSDSKASPTGFTRGTNGVIAKLDDIANKTANIVGYIGEWHSHPPRSSVLPSNLDVSLLTYLAKNLAEEGNPALMVIIGDNSISVCLEDQC